MKNFQKIMTTIAGSEMSLMDYRASFSFKRYFVLIRLLLKIKIDFSKK